MERPAPSISRWRKSTRSTDASSGNCVEVGTGDHTVWVRDSKDPYGPMLAFLDADWSSFVNLLRGGLIH